MSETDTSVGRTVALPAEIARRVTVLARTQRISGNRVLVDLIEAGLHSKDTEKERFAAERQRLPQELARRSVRRTVALRVEIAKRVTVLAKTKRISGSRVLVGLIEAGLHSKDIEKERFSWLVKRLSGSPSAAQRQRSQQELARMTFGIDAEHSVDQSSTDSRAASPRSSRRSPHPG